jgi:putative transposase
VGVRPRPVGPRRGGSLGRGAGAGSGLSKSTVSRVCEQVKTEFDAWQRRDLGGIELEYLFLDGSQFRMHPGARAEPVLCAWGITTQGSPVLVGLAPGASEGHDPWASFLEDLVDRGLRPPLLVITDGASGLIGAVELVLANSLRQRVWCIAAATCSPRSPLTPRLRSRRPSGRSSTTSTPSPATRRSPRPASGRTPSPTATTTATPQRSPACWTPCPSSPASCGSPRALGQDPPHQPDRADLRGDPPADQGDRPAARRAVVSVAGVGGAGPGSRGWRGVVMTPAAVRLLQELRRQLHHRSRLEEVVDEAETVTPAA